LLSPGRTIVLKDGTALTTPKWAARALVAKPLGKFDGEFASHSSTYAGTGTFRYRW
jgi:hypothetical protein